MDKFNALQSVFESHLNDDMDKFFNGDGLGKACKRAMVGGKRIRPLIILSMSTMFGGDFNRSIMAAIAVECFHKASLIIDDLPCMDDDDMRCGRLALHIEFGESIAILSSYSLISHGYGKMFCIINKMLSSSASDGVNSVIRSILDIFSEFFGNSGVTGGQYLDLFPPHNVDERYIFDVIKKKTVCLFEMSFSIGWLLSGGDMCKLHVVKEISNDFGMAFQLMDDLLDVDDGNVLNSASFFGVERAKAMCDERIKKAITSMKSIEIFNDEIHEMVTLIFGSVI